MPEVIQLEGSPADLLGNAPREDDAGSEPAQEDDDAQEEDVRFPFTHPSN